MPQNKNVLLVLWSGLTGGSERQVLDIVRHLPKRGYTCTVCFLSQSLEMATLLEECNTPWFEIGMRSGLDFWSLRKLIPHLRKGGYDIIHEHGGNKLAIYFYKWFAPRSRTMFTIHNGEPPEMYRKLRLWGEVKKIRKFDRVISVSSLCAKEWVAKTKRHEIFFESNAIDLARFEKQASPSEPNAPLIIVGRLIPSKRVPLLVKWLLPILEKYRRRLLIVGDGPDRGSIEALLGSKTTPQIVELMGMRFDVPELLASASMFVFASKIEAYPLALVEAHAAGLPIVCVDLPGLEEVVEHGVTGYRIQESIADSEFPKTVEMLLQNPTLLSKMGKAGRARIEARNALTPWLDRIEFHYHALLEGM